MASPSLPSAQPTGRRVLFPIIFSALHITLQSSKKNVVCKILVDGREAFSFPGTALSEDALRDCHAFLAREATQLQVQLFSDGKLYVQAEVPLWDILASEEELTVAMWKRNSDKVKQKGTLKIRMKCYEDHLDLYHDKVKYEDCPIFSNLARLLNVLKEVGSINARAQKLSRYCLATSHEFLRLDIGIQQAEQAKAKLARSSSAVPLVESVDPSSLRQNALEDVVLQCRRQMDYLKRTQQMHCRHQQKSAELRSIGSEILDSVAKVSFVLCYYAHIYTRATYPNILSLSPDDHKTLLRAHERLLYLRARMVYLSHSNPGSPPEAMDDLIEDVLRFAIPEAREEGWRKSAYTTILSCFCGIYADKVFDTINKKLRDLEFAEAAQRDTLRRLLAHMLQGVDWIPKSLILKASDLAWDGTLKVGEGGFGVVHTGRLAIVGKRDLQRVAIKSIKFLSSGTPEARKKQRRQMYLEIVNCWTLKHPKVLPLLGVDLQRGETSLVSPFKEHGDILNVLFELKRDRGSFKYHRPLVELSHKWIGEIATGLTYLHTENIIHGDLRGNNVFVNDDLSIVIADFGLSVFANGHSKNYESRRDGNNQWLSPELLEPSPHTRPTKASDIYSFAMVCIETHTGQSPFPGCRVESIRDGERPPRPNEPSRHQEPEGNLMNNELWSLVERCWDGDTSLRPSAAEVEQRLKELGYLQ